MATIIVFNNDTGALERYERATSEPMPYNIGGTLTVGEFLKGESFGYTDSETMAAWNLIRSQFQKPIRVDMAFVRISSGRCTDDRQHFAGTAFMMGSNLAVSDLDELYEVTRSSGAFSYVAPRERTSTSIHADRRYMPSNTFLTRGFPTLYRGSRSNYVLLAQDALNALGYNSGTVDGIYGQRTESAVRAFENARRLTEDGIITYDVWESLLNMNCPPASAQTALKSETDV